MLALCQRRADATKRFEGTEAKVAELSGVVKELEDECMGRAMPRRAKSPRRIGVCPAQRTVDMSGSGRRPMTSEIVKHVARAMRDWSSDEEAVTPSASVITILLARLCPVGWRQASACAL